MSKILSIERRFKTVFVKFLDIVSSIVDDLRDEDLTYYESEAVKVLIRMVKTADQSEFMTVFAKLHHHWNMIIERDEEFIVGRMHGSFKHMRIPIDVDLIDLPFLKYESFKFSEKWRDVPEDDLPVNNKDIDTLWYYISAMVKITCEYIEYQIENETVTGTIDPELKQLFLSINTEKWKRLLEDNSK